jgi:adenosine deaminase
MCFLRDLTQESAFETLELALPYKDWIIAIGLDSAEVGHPPEKFKSVFKKAKELGFLTVAHAGEEGPSEYIYQSLDILNVSRIDHGVGCINDIPLMKRLSKEKTPLTTCPLSNLKLKVYEQLKDHPLKKLLENDLCVTINSDDPAYFGGYINENYLQCQQHLNLNKKDIYQLARNSFEASFLSDKEKQKYFDKLDKFYRDFK